MQEGKKERKRGVRFVSDVMNYVEYNMMI